MHILVINNSVTLSENILPLETNLNSSVEKWQNNVGTE